MESAFEATGLELFNTDRIVKQYRKLNKTNNSDDSSISEFERKDWRKADRVIKSAINKSNKRVRCAQTLCQQ